MPASQATGAPARSSLFTRILALLMGAVLVAQALAVAAILIVSPAPPAAVTLTEVAQSIDTGEGPLVVTARRREPVPVPPEERAAAALAARDLAVLLGRDRSEIVVDLAPEQRGMRVELVRPENSELLQAALVGPFRVSVREEDGSWTEYAPARRPLRVIEAELLALFLATMVLVLPLAWWFARLLARPFAQLAAEAEQIGRNPHAVPGTVEGPQEAERVGRALARMQEQLADHVTERTRLLAGIAHDMRTPLSRLRFRIEDLPGRTKQALDSDLAEMEAMMAAAIDFGRATSSSGPRERLELRSLVEQVAGGLADSSRIALVGGDPILVEGDPLALRRLFANLLDNAVRHGGSAEVSFRKLHETVRVEIADRGPGLAAEELDRVFAPFHRSAATRAAGIEGTGLGLAVVRAIARAHGGEVELRNRDDGGLVASVSLPLAAGAG